MIIEHQIWWEKEGIRWGGGGGVTGRGEPCSLLVKSLQLNSAKFKTSGHDEGNKRDSKSRKGPRGKFFTGVSHGGGL